MTRSLKLLGLSLLTIAAAPIEKPTDYSLPPYVQAYQPTTKEERGMWMDADEDERVLRDSSLLIRDEKLTNYVKQVLCTEVGADRCQSARVYILEVPQFNASMAPNGTMRVWSGLLLRSKNEAELASVLGHEFAHFELRHSIAGAKQARNAMASVAWLSAIVSFGAMAGAAAGGGNPSNYRSAGGLFEAAIIGTYFKFNRDQEAAADMLSLKYSAATPYDPQAASHVWTYMIGESDAREVARGNKSGKELKTGFFDTHPASAARAAYLKAEADKLGKTGDLRAKEYRAAISPFLPRLLAAQVKSNDFGGSEYLLQSLAGVEGWTGELLFQRGELYRQRNSPRDLSTAAQFFREAVAKGYTDPLVHRELGLSLLRNGETTEGKAALQKYITAKPDASDIGVIKALAN